MSRRDALRGLLALLALPGNKALADPPDQRLVSVGGGVTETVFALGAGSRLVGVDTTSTWPEAAQQLPTVGYQHALPVEGIAALRPSAVLHDGSAGPERTLRRLQRLGIDEVVLPGAPTLEGFRRRTLELGAMLGATDRARELVSAVDIEIAEVRETMPQQPPRAAFLMSHGEGAAVAAGRETKADALLGLAGGQNVFTEFRGYRPVGREALLAKRPDVVLTTGSAASGFAPVDAPVLHGDTLFWLGFGPRLGEAVAEVAVFLRNPVVRRSPLDGVTA